MLNGMKIPRGFMVVMGIIIGTFVGALADNVGLLIVIGLAIGSAAEAVRAKIGPSN
jgi:hypothetical protein